MFETRDLQEDGNKLIDSRGKMEKEVVNSTRFCRGPACALRDRGNGQCRLGVHVPGRCGVPGSGHLSPGPMLGAFPGAWQDGCVPPPLLLGGIIAA